MKKVLVTGSGGFLFSNFIRKALYNKLDYNFVSIDLCKSSNVLNNIYANKGHKFYIGDVADKHFINVIFELERPDIVIHGAAETSLENSTDASNFIHSNILGTQVIVDACLKWCVERLIYTSTGKVYGPLFTDTASAWAEEATLSPRNLYSASKAAGEIFVKVASQNHGLNYNITRSCNSYGPRQPETNLIPKIIESVLNKQKFLIYGNGMQLREWLYVEDHYSAMMKIIETGLKNEIYNISSGHEFSNLEVFHEVCNIMDQGHDLIEFVADSPNNDFRNSVDASKLRSLGWKPTLKFKAGLYQTVQWYLNNRWFFKSKN